MASEDYYIPQDDDRPPVMPTREEMLERLGRILLQSQRVPERNSGSGQYSLLTKDDPQNRFNKKAQRLLQGPYEPRMYDRRIHASNYGDPYTGEGFRGPAEYMSLRDFGHDATRNIKRGAATDDLLNILYGFAKMLARDESGDK